jgi:hypothetical protein
MGCERAAWRESASVRRRRIRATRFRGDPSPLPSAYAADRGVHAPRSPPFPTHAAHLRATVVVAENVDRRDGARDGHVRAELLVRDGPGEVVDVDARACGREGGKEHEGRGYMRGERLWRDGGKESAKRRSSAARSGALRAMRPAARGKRP